MTKSIYLILILVVFIGGFFLYRGLSQYDLPDGETTKLEDGEIINGKNKSNRTIYVTDDVKHSVPLDEILSGGPAKDGIPSIDDPKFISTSEADKWLTDGDVGTGLCLYDNTSSVAFASEECRFYPYKILVRHELVNDTVAKQPVLISYCPLCFTGIVFERKLDGEVVEFGTSGMLWKSNLVMYNRTEVEKNESLWSQVLGEAIVGEHTGTKLKIIPSDVVKYSDWKSLHSGTVVLSQDTGIYSSYERDPYGDYYTSEKVSFGVDFEDDRLHPKANVLGIDIDGKFKAYHIDALEVGETTDTFNGKKITINKKTEGEIRMFVGEDKKALPYIGGFWFSWLAAHPGTELYK
jgi:hypothetical protein